MSPAMGHEAGSGCHPSSDRRVSCPRRTPRAKLSNGRETRVPGSPSVQAWTMRGARVALIVQVVLILACSHDVGVETASYSMVVGAWRFGAERIAYVEIHGNYEYPERHPANLFTGCSLSLGQENPEYLGILERSVWEELLVLDTVLDAGAQLDSVTCPGNGAEAAEWSGVYATYGYGVWVPTCFVRSDENRPETTAFLDLLDRVIDESIDCPGS